MSYDNLDQRYERQSSDSGSSQNRAASNTAREAYNAALAGSGVEGGENTASSLPAISFETATTAGAASANGSEGGWSAGGESKLGLTGAEIQPGQTGGQNVPLEVQQLFSTLDAQVSQLTAEVSQLSTKIGQTQSEFGTGQASLEQTDPTINAVVSDAINNGLSATGQNQLDQYIAQNYTTPGNDGQLLNNSLSGAGFSDADGGIVWNVLQQPGIHSDLQSNLNGSQASVDSTPSKSNDTSTSVAPTAPNDASTIGTSATDSPTPANTTLSTIAGETADTPATPGGITLPTPASASDVATALASGAGTASDPNIIQVSGDSQLQNALSNAQPGETIELASGTYQPFAINNSGTAGDPITVEAAPGQDPIVDSSNAQYGVSVQGNYVAVEGLQIADSNYNSLTLAGAQAADGNGEDWTYDGVGIMVGDNADTPQHITLENNSIQNVPGGGLQTMQADDVAIVGNNIQNSGDYSSWGSSGISVWHSEDPTGQGGTGAYVLDNQVDGVQQQVDSESIGQSVITDGNGIILDTNNWQGYNQSMLVEGNYTYNNNRGIQVGNTNDATVQGNTTENNDTNSSFGLQNIALFNADNVSLGTNYSNDGTPVTDSQTGLVTSNASYTNI